MDLRLDIDLNKLEEEWQDQATQVYHFACRAADAQRDLDQAKSRLDIARAKADSAIRKDPESFGISKATVDSVRAGVEKHPEVTAAVSAVGEAKHSLSVMQAACNALEHRKRALTMQVELLKINYWNTGDTSSPNFDDDKKRSIRSKGRRRS